jgi:putative transposase
MLPTLERLFRKVRDDLETELVTFNGELDHAHLLVHFPPKISLALGGQPKGVSSRKLKLHHSEVTDRYIKSVP